MSLSLYGGQIEALSKMKNGCILAGETGSGKSRCAVAYYYLKECDGSIPINDDGEFTFIRKPRDLYIITTAKKRDGFEWEHEIAPFRLFKGENQVQRVNVVIDSWNNIKKYRKVYGAFFIFDEQRVVGRGAWVKSFLDITRKNHWILLSATPGDTWSDYIPVFIANGFYKNPSDFNRQHCVFSRFSKYPQIERYIDEGILIRHRNDILIPMKAPFEREHVYVRSECKYSKEKYRRVWMDRWDIYDDCPIEETGKLFYLMRKVVNEDPSRVEAVDKILKGKEKAIIFYNFTYELEALRSYLDECGIPYAEWNGERHEELPTGERWVYLVQYSAGCEGWNCVTTDTIIFYSQSYSYRMTHQAEGRIDRYNSPYKVLYYYKLKSTAPIDLAIGRALAKKKNFNEKSFSGR